MNRIFCLLFALFFSPFAFGTEQVFYGENAWNKVKGASEIRVKEGAAHPDFIQLAPGFGIPENGFQGYLAQQLNLPQGIGFSAIKKETCRLGLDHTRYQQTWYGIPVEFGQWLTHSQDGSIISMNGRIYNRLNGPAIPIIMEDIALQLALDHLNAHIYKWELPEEEAHLVEETGNPNATYFPDGEFVLLPDHFRSEEPELHPAWKFRIYAHRPMMHAEVYVDALTGVILWEQNLIHTADAPGTAVTGFSGIRPIVADSYSGGFRLREAGRGNGIRTFNMNRGTSYNAATDFTDNDNYWDNANANLDEFATDAHWGAEMTWDYFFNKFGRNSIDGNGFTLRSYVHYDVNYSNAFWDGYRMTYGDGGGSYSPFTALDIAGHEITHGLTSNSANLIYENEHGALNESFSDIFGTTVEFMAKPGQANWTIGENIGTSIRNMMNPKLRNHPNCYGGQYWYTGTQDNGGVHINSGVQNRWFYLLTIGGNGTNDLGNTFNVTGIGMDDAAAVAFRNLTVYLTPTSVYADARFYAIKSAIDLFGSCSPEVASVTNAWHAVGVGSPFVQGVVSDFVSTDTAGCIAPFTVKFQNLSSNGNTFLWNFGDGNTSTAINPTHTYASQGTYTVTLSVDGGTCGSDTRTKTGFIVIDPSQPCVSILPLNGTAATQIACSGKLFDNGGPSGNYSHNSNAFITIAPVGAATITLQFVSFDIEAGSGPSCNYDFLEIFDGPNTSFPSLGKFCNTTGSPGTIQSTRNAVMLHFYSDQGVDGTGFEMNWICNTPNAAPVADFFADVTETCTGMVSFTDLSTNAPNSWLWDFGDGTLGYDQNPTHQYSQPGTYTVTMTAFNSIGDHAVMKIGYIVVNMPELPIVSGATVCYGETALLTATGTGQLTWYDSPSGGNVVTTGNTHSVYNLQSTEKFYVESKVPGPISHAGPPDNTFGTGGNFTGNQHLVFDVHQPATLLSVKVYAQGSGNRIIELRDNLGNVLQDATVNVPAGESRVNLNFDLTPGTNYQLGTRFNSQPNLYRNSSNPQYPYQLHGVLTITESSAGVPGYYYFFYDWEVKEADCQSARAEVVALLDCENSVPVNSATASVWTLFPNPAAEFTHILFTGLSNTKDPLTVTLFDYSGKLVHTETFFERKSDSAIRISLHQLAAGVYFVKLNNGSSEGVQKLIVSK